MNKSIFAITIASTLALSTPTFANGTASETMATSKDSAFYVGAMIGQGLHGSDSLDKLNLTNLTARFGYNINTNMAIEARLGAATDSDELSNIEKDVDSLAGIYAVGTMPITERFSFYALIGVSSVEITTSDSGMSNTDTISGASLGGGFEYNLTKRISFNAELINYVDKKAEQYGGMNIGVKFSF